MVVFVWLEEGMQEKEEWRFVAVDYGGLSMMVVGTVTMPLLLVDNLDSIRPIQVLYITP